MPIPVIPDTHSRAFRTPVPIHSGHLFRRIPATPWGQATLEVKGRSSAHRMGGFSSLDAFLKMEVIHSPGATSFNQLGRSGAVGNFLTFASSVQLFQVEGFFHIWGAMEPLRCAKR